MKTDIESNIETDNSLEELALRANSTSIIKLSNELEDIMSTLSKDHAGSYTIDRKTFEETYAIYVFKQYKNVDDVNGITRMFNAVFRDQYKEIYVVNTDGTVAYVIPSRIPPIYTNTVDFSIGDKITKAVMSENNIQGASILELHNVLKEITNRMSLETDDYTKKWLDAYNAYRMGIEMLMNKDSKKNITPTTKDLYSDIE